MQGILRHRPRGVLRALLGLAAAAMLSFGGVASAATAITTTICNSSDGWNCNLAVSAPESVGAGQPFTVKVSIVNGAGTVIPRNDFCGVSVLVTLEINQDGTGPVFYSATASRGVATFSVPGLSGPQDSSPGDALWYSLVVSANQASGYCGYWPLDTPSVAVVNIPAGQPIAPCPDNVSCTQTASGNGSAATLFADTGYFDANFEAFVPGQGCGDGGPRDHGGVLNFTYTPDSLPSTSQKTIVFALDHATTGIGRYQMCWQSPNRFKVRGGGWAPGNATDGYVGYLPICARDEEEHGTASPPCVLYKHSGPHNSAFFGILAPPGDPKVYPGTP